MKFNLPRPTLPKRPFVRPTLPDRSQLVLVLGGGCLLAACLYVFAGPGLGEVQQTSRETAVRSNAATLQLAAETYAAQHQGRYATDPLDLVVLLPGDRAPHNPYTGEVVAFTDEPGGITYRSPTRGGDYVIEGWGRANTTEPLIRLMGRAVDPRPGGASQAGLAR